MPCAGRGTRLGALTQNTPKELLPLRGKPLLLWTLQEAAAAGLERAVVVTSPGKPEIATFLAAHRESRPSVEVVTQPEPLGLGDAITRARGAAGAGGIAVMLPDNFFERPPLPPAVAPVLAAHRATGQAAVLLAEIDRAAAHTKGATGRALHAPRTDGWVNVLSVDNKGAGRFDPGDARAWAAPIGRMVFGAEVFALLEEERRRLKPGQELDDVPVLQRLAAEGRLVGVLHVGAFFDVGVPEGYAAAQKVGSGGRGGQP